MLSKHECSIATATFAGQPAGLRGGRAAAQLQRRRRRTVRHPVGHQPPDQGLEDELGAPLFVRGTRHVEITQDGQTLLRCGRAAARQLDASVRHIRRSRSRQRVSVTTFASFGSLWLLPRIEAFQRSIPTSTSASGARRDRRSRRPRARPRAALLQPEPGAGRRDAPVRRDADADRQPQPLASRSGRRRAAAGARRPTSRSTRCSRKTTNAPAPNS